MIKYDIAVIGGGPAGYIAAIKGSQLGARVILFEKDNVGGTCLNRGCIPTKSYLKTAEYIHTIQNAKSRGIHLSSTEFKLNMMEVVSNKNQVVDRLTSGVAGLLKAHKVDVIKAEASLKSSTQVIAADKTYSAKSIILCGGSKAGILPIPGVLGNPDVVTSDGILELTQVPRRLTVIGGGVIGVEMASAFSFFGSAVTIIEVENRLIPTMDKAISDELENALTKQGVQIFTSQKVAKIETKNGSSCVFIENETKPILADKVLLSIGREANIGCLGALANQIKVSQGKIIVNDQMQTNIPNIYAAGDINGKNMLAHAAFKMGEVAAINASGQAARYDSRHVPGCIYTLPEAAFVGMTEEQAHKAYDAKVGFFPFRANARSLASGEANGFVKVVIDMKYGEILGVHIVGAVATELIAEACALMAMEVTAHEVTDIIHAHPTYSEAFMEACADALGHALHLPPKAK